MPLDPPPLTPTGELVLEVLAARRRLGEPHWPFSKRVRATLEQLQERGYLSFESDPTGTALRTWLNPDPDGPAGPWLRNVIDYRPLYGTDPDDLALQWARHALDWLVDPLHGVIGVAVDPDDAVVLWVSDKSTSWTYIDQWSPDCPVPVRVRYVDDYDVHYLAAPGECRTCKQRQIDEGIDAEALPRWHYRPSRKLVDARRRIREAAQDAGYRFVAAQPNPVYVRRAGLAGPVSIEVLTAAPWLGEFRCDHVYRRTGGLSLERAVVAAEEWFDANPAHVRGAAPDSDQA